MWGGVTGAVLGDMGHGQHCEVLSCPSFPGILPSRCPIPTGVMSHVHSQLPLIDGLSGEVLRPQ